MLCLSFYCEPWSCRCSCMESMSVSSSRCCMFVSCVHPMAFFNAAFGMIFSLLMMSVVRGKRGVGGVCEMCMCLTRGDVEGEGDSG